MKSIKYIFAGVLGLIVLVTVGGFVFLKVETGKAKSSYLEKEKRFNERIAQHLEMFQADQKTLSKNPIFQQPKGNRDAGPYLINWLTPKMTDVTSKKDFKWFKKLNDFDYWDLETQITLGNLFIWTKLRLMDAMKKNKMQEGIKDIRNLARLLYSTEDSVHAMAAIKVLDLGREALEKAKANQKNVKGITPITETEIAVMRRTIYALPAFTSVMTRSEYKKMVPTFYVGKCIAIEQSGMDYYLLYEPIMSQVFASHYSDMDQLLLQTPECRLKRFRNIWQNKSFVSKNMSCEDVFATTQLGATEEKKTKKCSKMNVFNVAKIPGAASMISYTLASIASPDWWEKYNEK